MCLCWRCQQCGLLQGLCKSKDPVNRMLGLEPPPASAAVRHASPLAGLPRPPSQTNSAGRSAASERTTLIHEEAEVEPAQQQLPAEQGATPDGPAAERQQAAPGPRGGGMVSRWRRRMGTGERLPDVLTREPQVAQALAPPQTPPPMDAEVCMALPALPACRHDSTSALSCSLKGGVPSCLLDHTCPGDTKGATVLKLLLGAHVLV